jgi:molybdate transport system permease protein
MDWITFMLPLRLSTQVAFLSSILVLIIGTAIAWWMTHHAFKGKIVVETIFMLPLVLPPTVIGFLLLVIFGRESWLGILMAFLFDTTILFTWFAAVIASFVVAFPLVYQTMKTGFHYVDRELVDAGRSIGASGWQVFRYITLPLCKRSLITAYILGFARSLGEFGATLMIAGNIPGRTQTLPTAIYVAVDVGNTSMAWLWTFTIIAISFLLLLFTRAKPNE